MAKKRKKKRCKKQNLIKFSQLLDLLKRCRRLNCCPLRKMNDIAAENKKFIKGIEILDSIDPADCAIPETNDVLLKKPTQYNNLSIINRNKKLSEFLIPEGYYSIVLDTLKRIRNTTNNAEKDSLIYPLLYNFRHYLELIMKDAIRNFRITRDEINQSQIGYKKVHSLLSIWNKLKTYIDDTESNECIAFGKLIEELHNIDPNSFSFRYSYKGNVDPDAALEPVFNNRIDVDIENLEKVIKKMHRFIEGINDLAYHQCDEYETNNS